MKIVADENITNVEALFSSYGELLTMPGRHISKAQLHSADALLVRSITNVNEALLNDTNISFVASATSGIDHIDTQYLKENSIQFNYAPGSNANSVVEYVFSSLAAISLQESFSKLDWTQCSFGIIGAGNIGGLLAQRLHSLKIPYLIYDPLIDKSNLHYEKTDSLENVLRQDIISIHTPLSKNCKYPSYHLINEDVISGFNSSQILINAARGGVVDNPALLKRLQHDNGLAVVLDAWENEPAINLQLLSHVSIGTPHIAGYSRDGKINGTEQIHQAFVEFFKEEIQPDSVLASLSSLTENNIKTNATLNASYNYKSLNDFVLAAYDIKQDHNNLAKLLSMNINNEQRNLYFDSLRKNYPVRREFQHYSLQGRHLNPALATLGFTIA